MINLIPPVHKDTIQYGRRNSMMIRWILAIALALAGLGIITAGGLFYLQQDTNALKTSIDETKRSLNNQDEAGTIKRAEEMNGNIKLALDVLSNEIQFSKLLQKIGEIMPPGTILESLSLTSELSGVGIDLSIGAQSYEAGTRAHVNLNDSSNGIFEKADLNNISCGNNADRPEGYPCLVDIRALFKADDNQLFLVEEGSEQ